MPGAAGLSLEDGFVMAERPPVVPGTVQPRWCDFVRISWWSLKAPFIMGIVRRRPLREDSRMAWMLVAALFLLYVALGTVSVLVGARWWSLLLPLPFLAVYLFAVPLITTLVLHTAATARSYMPLERDAVLRIRQRGGEWRIDNHGTRHVGDSAATGLRERLIDPLLAACDERDLELFLVAASTVHARLYRTLVPDLIDEGPARPRGRRMRRARASDRK